MAHVRELIDPVRMRCPLACAAMLLSAGCGSPPDAVGPPAGPPAPPPALAPPPPDVLSGPAGELHSARFDLRLPLPDGAGWRVEDGREPWLSATHAASSTSLLVRTWRPDDRASRAACEAQARLWRDLPGGEGAAVVERRRIDAPEGFDTAVEIGVAPPARAGLPIEGFVVVFGGWARRCFAYVVTTRAAGPGAEQAVAGRLAAMVEVSLAGVRLESELSPAMPRGGPR